MFKCQFCGATANKAGVEFKNQGALNLHERSCPEMKAVKALEELHDEEVSEMVEDKKPEKKYKGKLCPNCGEKLKLLNPNVEWCKPEIKAGYEKVCMNCEVVF